MKIKKNKKYAIILCIFLILCLEMVSCKMCEHVWMDANCQTPQICSICGTKKGDANPTNHIWNEPTCKNPKTCSVCGLTEGTISSSHSYEGDKCKNCGCIQLTKWNFKDYLDFSVTTRSSNTYSVTCYAESVGNPHYKYNDVKIIVKCVSYNNVEDYGKDMLVGEEVTYHDEDEITLFLNLAGNDNGSCSLFVIKQNLVSYSIESVSGTVQEY